MIPPSNSVSSAAKNSTVITTTVNQNSIPNVSSLPDEVKNSTVSTIVSLSNKSEQMLLRQAEGQPNFSSAPLDLRQSPSIAVHNGNAHSNPGIDFDILILYVRCLHGITRVRLTTTNEAVFFNDFTYRTNSI